MVNFLYVYREMVEKKEKQVKDLTKQLDAVRSENDTLRQKISDLEREIYNQREEHVNQCLTCDKFDFVRKISELESQVEELKAANNRTNVVSHVRGKSLINERDRTAELEKVLKDIFNKISEVLK